MSDENKIKEVFICKVCGKVMDEDERCWLQTDTYCEPCVEADAELKESIRKCEKDVLIEILKIVDDETRKEILERFSEYFKDDIQIFTETCPIMKMEELTVEG